MHNSTATEGRGWDDVRRPDRFSHALWNVLLALSILVGVVIRCVTHLDQGLWEDEIIAATHAVQPLPALLVDVVRNDIHPPLYFIQLHLWALVSQRDGWLVANSVLWSLASIWSMWASLRREGQARLGLTAAAFLAVLPSGVWMSHDVRPYAWLCVLLIWAFHFARRAFDTTRPRTGDMLAAFGFCLAIIYSHAIGFLAVFCMGSYAAALLAGRRAPARAYLSWFTCFGLLGVAALPILISNLLHDANLAGQQTITAVIATLAEVITVSDKPGWVFWSGLVIYLGVAGIGLALRRNRLVAICFVLLPLLVAIMLGFALKPIFKANLFATLLTPFVAIVLAKSCLRIGDRWRSAVTATLFAGLAATAIATWSTREPVTGYLAAARTIRAESRPGDVVFIPQQSMFWGMAWYLDGPHWGSPLAIANPPSPAWQGVYRHLGPRLLTLLHLVPTGQAVAAPGGLTLLIGNDSSSQAAQGRRVWLVTNDRADLAAGFPPDSFGDLRRVRQQKIFALLLNLYE